MLRPAEENKNSHPQYPWYALIDSSALSDANSPDHKVHILEQGDILEEFRILTRVRKEDDPTLQVQYPGDDELFRPTFHDLIVMSQSCDLAQLKTDVIACEVYLQSDYGEADPHDPVVEKKGLQRLRKGDFAALYLLNQCTESMVAGHERPYRIVDFPTLYSFPLVDVLKHVASKPHLRLLSPYREHLSQAFARFFMRVGLPSDIRLPEDKPAPGCKLCSQFFNLTAQTSGSQK